MREFAAKTGLEITVYAAGVVRTVLPTTRQDPSGRADFGSKRPYIANLIVPVASRSAALRCMHLERAAR